MKPALHRCARRLATCLLPLALAACGGGEVVSQFAPARIVAFGDGFADLGQDGARYTVNDGSVNNWTLTLAADYGLTLASSASGGLSYATGNARVASTPDAAGNGSTPTVVQQVDTFLASGSLGATDLVVLNAGTADLVAEAQAYFSGTQDEGTLLANVGQAGTELGTQVRRLVTAGATHVVVVGAYNLGKSAWAQQLGQASVLEAATTMFNQKLLISIADLGATVLYVDAAYYFNLVAASPSSYSLSNVADLACTSTDSGAGIGTGSGQVNSNLCTSSTLASGIDPAVYLFADRVYLTPAAQRLFGAYAYSKIHARW